MCTSTKHKQQKQTKTTNKVEIKKAHFYNCSPKLNPKLSFPSQWLLFKDTNLPYDLENPM
jgi:hypothetical protein